MEGSAARRPRHLLLKVPAVPDAPEENPVVKFLKSPAFREIVRLLLAALAGAASSGCGVFPEPNTPARAVFECRVQVLKPFVGDVAGALVPQIAAGQVEPVQLLLSLGLEPKDILAVAEAYHACAPAPAAPPAASVIDG